MNNLDQEEDADDFEITMEQAMLLDFQNESILRLGIDREAAFPARISPSSSNVLKPDDQFPHLREYRDIGFTVN